MKQKFTATVWKEGSWYVARCIEVTVASQGKSEKEALANLVEAMELLFEEAKPDCVQKLKTIEVNIDAA